MTVTSKTTRTELLEMLTAAEAERDALAKETVRVAMAAAKTNGFCTVVEKTLRKVPALAKELPPTFVLQRQYRKGSSWVDQEEERSERNVLSYFRNYVTQKNTPPRNRSNDIYLSAPSYLNENNVDGVLATVRNAKRVIEAAKREAPEFKAPEFPKYRVVKRVANTDEVIRDES